MALFAMLAVLTSPALAFACCCGQEMTPVQASVQTPQIPVSPVQASGASHPGCQGHAEAHNAPARSEGASRVSASNLFHAAPVGVSAPSEGPCFQSLCECAHGGDPVLAFTPAQNTSSFSPLVLGVVVPAFSSATSLPSSVRFAFASDVARPRGPDLEARSGRAPPTFSF